MKTTPLATTRGRQFALAALADRRAGKPLPPNHNAEFPAGAPMQFNCDTCLAVITVPEDWTERPHHCEECAALIRLGWME
jgi:hypothetical protein